MLSLEEILAQYTWLIPPEESKQKRYAWMSFDPDPRGWRYPVSKNKALRTLFHKMEKANRLWSVCYVLDQPRYGYYKDTRPICRQDTFLKQGYHIHNRAHYLISNEPCKAEHLGFSFHSALPPVRATVTRYHDAISGKFVSCSKKSKLETK